MKIPKKKFSEIEYTKYYLANIGKLKKCSFCKYFYNNYKTYNTSDSDTSINILTERCNTCIHSHTYSKLNWYRDNFKPLYNWEIED